MDDSAPSRVTVVVPVRNRRVMLRELLDGLRAQTFDDFEVVVVDDHSEDGSDDEVEKEAAEGAPVRLIRNPGRGAVAARTAGVAASESEYLAFIDSDCVPSPGWLAAGVSALAGGADVVTGLTRPMRPVAPLERSIAGGEEGLFPTCNVFYRRAAFDGAGGFDADAARRHGFAVGERMARLGGGEDVLLGWRVRRTGRSAYAPEAVVEHQVFEPDIPESFRRAAMLHGFPGLVREIPELRDTAVFRRRFLLGAHSRLPVYACAAALATRRRPVIGAALAWWVGARAAELRRGPGTRKQKLSALPVEMALDVVGAAALLVGSYRTRTLVL